MLLLSLLVLAPGYGFAAPAWSPLRVALDCQSQERVDICTYIRGSLDALAVVRVVPLSEAQVVLHLNATSETNTDFVQLRAVSDLGPEAAGTPPSFEQGVEVDYRLTVDEQRALLDPVLYRVLSPYLCVLVPGAVSVLISEPEGAVDIGKKTTPFGFSIWAGGFGLWSQDYRSLSMWTGVSLYRKTSTNQQELWINYQQSIELQPSLVVESTEVDLTSNSSAILGATTNSWNLGEHWTIGGNLRGGHEDPQGQYLGTARLHGGLEYNLFPSDDPRGNVLAVAYLVGGQADWYNQPNTLGQEAAVFPTQMLIGSGSVRVDTVSLGLDLSARSQIYPFFQRYVLSGSLEADLTVGDHIDFSMQLDATQQAVPGPASIDSSSYEEVTRASYAQPLEVQGFFNFRFHWDNTNSARNNRFNSVEDIDVTAGL
ncbi:MAG: hypothetical protein EXR69_00425 [Myxococcales bacterium]|nr:hypothetical protein [Myxococcales bacterium]